MPASPAATRTPGPPMAIATCPGPRASPPRSLSQGHLGTLHDLAFCVSNGLGMPQDPAPSAKKQLDIGLKPIQYSTLNVSEHLNQT